MALFRRRRDMYSPTVRYVYGGDMGVRVANMDAAALYRAQPNLRAVVSFLADNAAQIPIKVHDRAGDNDRPRVTDSPAALLLQQPNPDMTPFEFKRWMYSDLLLYERFLCLISLSADTPSGWELRPVPNQWIRGYEGKSPFAPESVWVGAPNVAPLEVPADRFILFHGYNPADPMGQYSRVNALKETLHEQVESNKFRRQMWHRGGRFNAYISRPLTTEKWSDEAMARFMETWKNSWAGSEAADGGGMPILEDGMEIKTVQFNSRDAQWAEAVKLSREDCAAIYHVNPALIWPGSGQTYASARDNARALYNDTLAPILMQATDRINMDLLPRVGEPSSHYVVYDITIKTQGTLEERISAMQTACGGPFMSREEVRAMLDLPKEPEGELIVPMNVLVGGLASNHDTDPTVERYNSASVSEKSAKAEVVGTPKAPDPPQPRKARGDPREGDVDELSEVYRRFFERQCKSVVPKIESGAVNWWNAERWNRELADDLYPAVFAQATASGEQATKRLWGDGGSYDARRTETFIRSMCERRAQIVNSVTESELISAIAEEGNDNGKRGLALSKGLKSTVRGVFEHAIANRSSSAGSALASSAAGWGLLEGCRQNKRRGEDIFKTWRTASGNPRSSHAAMNGETVQYDQRFSNGAMWPGDMVLPANETANCRCELEIEVRGSGSMRIDSATAGNVARVMGVEGDCNLSDVYDAYQDAMTTIGMDPATKWADMSKEQRGNVIAELHTRDTQWVAHAKAPKVGFETRELEAVIRSKRMHELHTGARLTSHGVPSRFQIDERRYFDEQKQLEQTVGLADLSNGYELKTLQNGGLNSVDDYIRRTKKKEGVNAIVFDNFENEYPISDAELFDFLRNSRRWSKALYLITRENEYLRAK